MSDAKWHPQFGDLSGYDVQGFLDRFGQPVAPTRSIVLATDQRTGSEWLCSLMAKTGRLGVPGEYINTPWMQVYLPDFPQGVAEQVAIAHRVGTTPNGVFAMKLHPWHFDRFAAEMRFEHVFPNPVFVFLFREDYLGQALSLVRASQSRSYHAFVGEKAEPNYHVEALDMTLFSLTANRTRWDRFFARNAIRPLRVSYENLLKDPAGELRAIAAFTGVEIEDVDLAVAEGLTIQRNDRTEDWRRRYHEERADLGFLDP